jgi:putative intracellular protease/amidase
VLIIVCLNSNLGSRNRYDVSQAYRQILSNNKIVSAVCHGPAAFTRAKLASSRYLLDGQPLTSFSNAGVDAVGFAYVMLFKFEDTLNKLVVAGISNLRAIRHLMLLLRGMTG